MKISGLAAAGFLAVAMAAGVPALAQQGAAPPSAKQAMKTEAPLRKLITGLATGKPDYDAMSPGLADATRAQLAAIQPKLVELGALKSVQYTETGPQGMDIYLVTFEKGALQFRIALDAEGKIAGAFFRPAP